MTAAAQRRAALVCALLGAALLGAAASLPAPFASEGPGPVLNVLGASNGTGTAKLITIHGRRTYPTSGALDLVTVSESGRPGAPLTLPMTLLGVAARTTDVVPVGVLYPPGESAAASLRQDSAEMDSSQSDATAAALGLLGIAVPTTIRVAGTIASAPAARLLRAGDVITSVDGHPVTDLPDLHARLKAAGGSATVGVRRHGQVRQVSVPLVRSGATVALGVYVDPAYHFPFRVTIAVDRIGGPSAGMMFALGIVDELTPGSLTGGHHVAGTGTIDPDGRIGAIGGIAQKMAGARSAGASVFLAPASNCRDVTGHVPDGLRVVRVSTLAQARDAVTAVAAGRASSLPGCPR